MEKFKFSVPVKTSDLIYPLQKLILELGKLKSIYRSEGLSSTQGQILVCIEKHGSMTIVGLTAELGLDKSTISQTLSNMQSNNLITLTESGSDRRYKHAKLTESGAKKVTAINASFDESLQNMLHSLETKDLNATTYGVLRFLNLLTSVRKVKDLSFKRILGATRAPQTGKSLFNLE